MTTNKDKLNQIQGVRSEPTSKYTPSTTTINCNESTEGETIEMKIERILTNNEPITDGAPSIYTERQQGTPAEYNIRTDRFDLAVDAMSQVTKSHLTKRQQAIEELKKKNTGTTEPAQKTGADTSLKEPANPTQGEG